jgi:FkbM family methyltransferase
MSRVINFRNKSFAVEDNNQTFWDALESGKWETTTFDVFDTHLDAETVFLDVGSWIGPTALYAATRVRRVVCVEADPVAASQLRRNIALNPELASRIEVIEKAISPTHGTVRLGARTGRGDSMSSVLLASGGDHWDVPSITPAELLAKAGADAKKVFVKVDIEGGEYALMPHMTPLASLPNVKFLVAFHPRFLPQQGLQRWVSAMYLSSRVFRFFKGFNFTRVKKHTIQPLRFVTALNQFGLAFYPARHSILMLRPS